jgi:hypothetical protein
MRIASHRPGGYNDFIRTHVRPVLRLRPLDLDKLRDPSEYHYHCGFVAWIERAIARRQLHRINPAVKR